MTRLSRLYAIADATFGDPVDIAARLLRGGAQLVQIRNKTASSRTLYEQARAVVGIAPPGTQVFVNDRADIAKLAGTAGVHVGWDDLPPSAVRRVVGNSRLVGLSTHNEKQAGAAALQAIDYVAVGPIFSTETKQNAEPPIGVRRLAEICRQVRLPVVAIGGIRLENVESVVNAGAASVAVISDLIGHPGIEERTRQFLDRLT